MAMSVSPDSAFALTVSSEHFIIKYIIEVCILYSSELPHLLIYFIQSAKEPQPQPIIFKTKWPGNASIIIRADSRVCAVGGWDGNIRLYSTKTCKPLGTLTYHRTSCQAMAFAHFCQNDVESDQVKQREIDDIQHWLASGGKDGRIALWKLDDFTRK
jgi:ASTRA-associated protein 1